MLLRMVDVSKPRAASTQTFNVNFTKTWAEYKNGFGSLSDEFWYGNEFIHRLTSSNSAVLRVDLVAHDGTTAYAQYDEFRCKQ